MMTLEERKRFVEKLTADFKKAKDENCTDAQVWMELASRYKRISANMNWYFCIERAAKCQPMIGKSPIAVCADVLGLLYVVEGKFSKAVETVP